MTYGRTRRGNHVYDNYFVKISGVASCLGSIEKPPFYAVRVYPSTVGTKGGIAIDINGCALGKDGAPIDGLFAAGNVADRIFGPFTIGNGVTIASAAAIGFRAASFAAGESLT